MSRIPDATIVAVRQRTTWDDLMPTPECPWCGTTGLAVTTKTAFFTCDQCGAGGDHVTYWMQKHNLTFNAAIQDLANRYGIR